MALGKRPESRQEEMWIAAGDLARSPGHPFYDRLAAVLKAADFDRRAEEICAPYYADGKGRPSIPPGIYFRMLIVGYFEDIGTQRGIAWKCADSLAARDFLGLRPGEAAPDHSSLTRIRQRLPFEAHVELFNMVLGIAREHGLLKGRTVAVDSTTIEANASMRSIRRKADGKTWRQHLEALAKESGVETPTAEDLARFDRQRKKKVSNKEWESASDPDARIAKMKDGRTRMAYKAEHAVDLDTGLVLAALALRADAGDTATLLETLVQAQLNSSEAGCEESIAELVADKGYNKVELLEFLESLGVRTYIPDRKGKRRWTDKPEGWEKAFRANRRRCGGERGKRLGRKRTEVVERGFAHVCDSGGARRTWLRGLQEVGKRHLIAVAGHNLGLVMRHLFGAGKPRAFAGLAAALRRPSGLSNAWHWPRSARRGARARRPARSLGFQGFRKKPARELSSSRTAFEWLALAA